MTETVPVADERSESQPEIRRPRRGTSRPQRSSRSRNRLRLFYFGLAAVWGFLAGSGGILGALSVMERPVEPQPLLLVVLMVALILALVGGAVAAAAYREISRRRG